MPPAIEDKKPVPTQADYELATVYFQILVEIAAQRGRTTYSALVDVAKARCPENEVVQNAIPVSTGRRLDIVRLFTKAQTLPDLSSIVVSKQSGECGIGFTRSFDPVAARDEVYNYDWSKVKLEFAGYVAEGRKSVKPAKVKKLTYEQAAKQMFDHYSSKKADLSPEIRRNRDSIIAMIIEGIDVEDAFREVLRIDA